MHKNILFLSKGENSSSTRYRALQYFPLYQQAGYEPTHITISGGIFPFLKAVFHASQADIVILLRKTFPAPIFWLLRKVSKKLIFELDDAIFCNTDGTHSETRMSRFIATVRQCDHVFAGNQYLADTAKLYQTKTTVIPTSLDTQKYIQQVDHPTDEFGLVWIGSKSTKKYIVSIIPAIEIAAESVPNLSLKIIADFELHSAILPIKNIQWAESTEAEEVNRADVGLAPLPPDSWTKGKCALKVLQYLAAGLPAISSPTSANGYVIDHLKSGYLAENESDWVQFITTAYKKKEQLKEMGVFGQKRVSTEFDIHIVFEKIIQKLETI